MTIDILKFNLFLLLELCTRTTIAYENINSCISCLIQTDEVKLKKIKPKSTNSQNAFQEIKLFAFLEES